MTPWLLLLVPLAGALAVAAASRCLLGAEPGRRAGLLTGIGLVALLVTLTLAVWGAATGASAEWAAWGPSFAPRLAIAGLARVMAVLVPVIAIPVVAYAGASLRGDVGLPRLLALLVAFTGVMELLVVANDFLTLLIAWELVGACSWALIGYDWRDPDRPRAARDAFLTMRAGDLGLYLAAGALVAATGSVRYEALSAVHGPALGVVAAGVLVAAAAKSAQLPFSPWLFRAMAGPTPASALLHSATMVAAGAYLLARLAPALAPVGWFSPTVAALGLATALAGGVVASVQDDLKRALAASTSAQYGLMFVAIGAGVPGAAGVHLVTHAAFKALLFLGAGVVLHAAGTLDLATIGGRGLRRALPRVGWLFAAGTLALAAVPPLGGAYSKEQIVAAAATAPALGGAAPLLAAGVLVAGLLSAFYAARLQLLAFGPSRGATALPAATDVPAAEMAALALLAALSVGLGLLWLPGARCIAARAVGDPLAAGATWEVAASLASVATGVALSWTLWRRGALVTVGLAEPVRQRIAAWLGLPAAAERLIVAPVRTLAGALAAFDDRVVDAGIRAATRVAAATSHAFTWWGERGVDGLVSGVAWATTALAGASRAVDDRGVDAAVEGVAREVGVAGAQGRRLQTGLAHDYYALVAVGALLVVLTAAVAVVVRRFL